MSDVEKLREIQTLPALIEYLRDYLEWPIEAEDIDDMFFEYNAEELGIDPVHAVHIKEIKQLRPLEGNQPWGIFWISFEKKRLPVVMLRRILANLVVKKRASSSKSTQRSWHLNDLLFISACGEEQDRGITFAHFCHDEEKPDQLPFLKVLEWDGKDAVLHLAVAHKTLVEKLRWPSHGQDIEAWRQQWASAFTLRHKEVLNTTQELVEELARLAHSIRERTATIIARETAQGPLRRLFAAFKTALIHDLTEEAFADVIAQTISYGLLAARFSHPEKISVLNLVNMIPPTNPFLRELMDTFLNLAGRRNVFDFDELGIQDVVDLLNIANADAVKADFGNRTRNEDPVIHFYEHFLKTYDKKLKVQRGVFYTPQPIVSYIVRSVHKLLQTEFGLEDGLASTITWGEMAERNPELKIPEGTSPDEFFVNILDPATGTATFLVEVFEVIFNYLKNKWEEQGPSVMPLIPNWQSATNCPRNGIQDIDCHSVLDQACPVLDTGESSSPFLDSGFRRSDDKHGTQQEMHMKTFKDYWNTYVPNCLLPRLYGYELLVAPYTIAHMKLGLKLSEINTRLGQPDYEFEVNGRAHIYLTNSLEPPSDKGQQAITGMFPALAHEAEAVNTVKRKKRFTVVIGNPPYSNFGQLNKIPFILDLLQDYKCGLNEKKINLDDDFIKFLRFSQWHTDSTGIGVIGIITNNSYLSGVTHRILRKSLMGSFGTLRITNLHGDSRIGEAAPGGSADENVFDIQQGVAILCGTRKVKQLGVGEITYGEVWGSRVKKYESLSQLSAMDCCIFIIEPKLDLLLFVPQVNRYVDEYGALLPLNSLLCEKNTGIESKRDMFTIHFDYDGLLMIVEDLRSFDDLQLRLKYGLPDDGRDWSISWARNDVARYSREDLPIVQILYRPFDLRWTLFTARTKGFLAYPRTETMRHLAGQHNLALITTRLNRGLSTGYFFCTRNICDRHVLDTAKDSTSVFPLYKANPKSEGLVFGSDGHLNFISDQVKTSVNGWHLRWLEAGLGDCATTAGPDNFFYYTYAVFHSPHYRTRYAEFLQIDFPRMPLTSSLDLFRALAQLGGDLVSLHLMESPKLDNHITTFIGSKTPEVEKVSYSDGTVWIDKAKAIGFRGVSEDVWNFHIGGYQVCEKWLKDRKGRTLTEDDISHYHRIVVALSETIRLMAEIDEVIDAHGGWPKAFTTDNKP